MNPTRTAKNAFIRGAMLSRWRVNTGRFPGQGSNPRYSADKEVNAYERGREGDARCPGRSKPKRVTSSRSAWFAPGWALSVWTRAGPKTERARISPRLRPISSFHRTGRPWSLRTLGPTTPAGCLFASSLLLSPRRRGGAASFNISRRPPPRELAGSHSLRVPSLPPSDSLWINSPSLVSTPRPERSLDSILMECLRGR